MATETFVQVGTYTYRSEATGKKYSLWAEGEDKDGNRVKPFLALSILNFDPDPIRVAAIAKDIPCLLCNNQFPLGHPLYVPEFEKVNP